MKKLFLISSSRYDGGEFWSHCFNDLAAFLGSPEKGRDRILFIPYADPDSKYDDYVKKVSIPLNKMGYEVVGMHTYNNLSFLHDKSISAVCVGGGNTWLLANKPELITARHHIKRMVLNGNWKYFSASAGTVMSGQSMITTNDMSPIVSIKNTQGFELVPFNINAHFIEGAIAWGHMGEPREERIRQVIVHDSQLQVVGLPEGCWIEGMDEDYILRGKGKAVIFRKDSNNSIWLSGEPFDPAGML